MYYFMYVFMLHDIYMDCFVISFCGVGIVIVVCRQRRRLSSSHFLFRTVSQKWLARLNSNLVCGCNWSSGCAVLFGDLKLSLGTYLSLIFSFPDHI